MAQLDRLLLQIPARRATALRMDPGQQPQLESPGGGLSPLLPNAVPSTLLEHLVMEVLPGQARQDLDASGQTVFTYPLEQEVFEITVRRGPQGLALRAEPVAVAHPEVVAEVPTPRAPAPALPASTPMATVPAATPTPTPRVAPSVPSRPPGAGLALAERLFQALLERKGSDLHLRSNERPLARIHGDLEHLEGFSTLSPDQLLDLMEALAPAAAWTQFRETHDADFAYAFEAGGCRLRVNFFHDRFGPGMVSRVIPNEIPDPDKLGLSDPIKRLADLSKGLVLVTGPTGSGKSTTLAAIIDLVNQRRTDHILTIEDPIEFVHPRKGCLVTQREVGTHTASFKSGLRAALREDPDVVLVGEMRDLETIAIALETAITGHLVFGTLHTSSAIGTIDRIVDQFPADRQQQIRVMLADALKACLSQTLLKKTSGGRVAAIESLFITPAIANLIREGKNFQITSAMQTGRAYGQKLMNDALVELIQAKAVDTQEAYLKCPDKESFMATLKRNNITWDPRGEERPLPL